MSDRLRRINLITIVRRYDPVLNSSGSELAGIRARFTIQRIDTFPVDGLMRSRVVVHEKVASRETTASSRLDAWPAIRSLKITLKARLVEVLREAQDTLTAILRFLQVKQARERPGTPTMLSHNDGHVEAMLSRRRFRSNKDSKVKSGAFVVTFVNQMPLNDAAKLDEASTYEAKEGRTLIS